MSYRRAVARMRIARGRKLGRMVRRGFRGRLRRRPYYKRSRYVRRGKRRFMRRRRRQYMKKRCYKDYKYPNQLASHSAISYSAATSQCNWQSLGIMNWTDLVNMFDSNFEVTSISGIESVKQIEVHSGTLNDNNLQYKLHTGVWTTQCTWRNNYTMPCNIAVYFCKSKENVNDASYGVGPLITGLDRLAGSDAGYETNPAFHLSDSKDFFNTFKVLSKKYVTLQPGDEFRKSFKIKPMKIGLHELINLDSFELIKNRSHIIIAKVWGVPAHESDATNINFGPARCDMLATHRCKFWVPDIGSLGRGDVGSVARDYASLTVPAVRDATDPAKEIAIDTN